MSRPEAVCIPWPGPVQKKEEKYQKVFNILQNHQKEKCLLFLPPKTNKLVHLHLF